MEKTEKKAEKALTRTSTVTTYKKNVTGFTLIEILIAIVLVAVITAIAIPTLSTVFRTSITSYARELANLFSDARDHAILNNMITRVHFDLDKQEYWAEESPAGTLLMTAEQEEAEKERQKEEADKTGKVSNPAASFHMVKEISPKKKSVPGGLHIIDVISPRYKDPITAGDAYIYFFPHGFTEAVTIHMENQEHFKQSLTINPLTGKTKLE